MGEILSKIGGEAEGLFKSILSPADKPESPVARHALRLLFCLGIIAASGAILYFSIDMIGIDALANPNPLKLMGLIMPIGIAGVALHLLLYEMIPKRHHETAKKVMAFVTVLLMIAGGYCFIQSAMLNAGQGPLWGPLLSNPWLDVGVVLAGGGALCALGYAIPVPRYGAPQGVSVDDPDIQEELDREYRASLPPKLSVWRKLVNWWNT